MLNKNKLSKDEKVQYFVKFIDDASKGYINDLLNLVEIHYKDLYWKDRYFA